MVCNTEVMPILVSEKNVTWTGNPIRAAGRHFETPVLPTHVFGCSLNYFQLELGGGRFLSGRYFSHMCKDSRRNESQILAALGLKACEFWDINFVTFNLEPLCMFRPYCPISLWELTRYRPSARFREPPTKAVVPIAVSQQNVLVGICTNLVLYCVSQGIFSPNTNFVLFMKPWRGVSTHERSQKKSVSKDSRIPDFHWAVQGESKIQPYGLGLGMRNYWLEWGFGLNWIHRRM